MINQANFFEMQEKQYFVDTTVSPLRNFEDLSTEEKKEVMNLKKSLKDYSSASLINFSSKTSNRISSDTDKFLRGAKINDLQEFNETMLNLSSTLKTVDTKQLTKRTKSPWENLPIIGSISKSAVAKKVSAIIANQQSVEKVVSSTETTLQKTKLTLLEDLARCNSMKEQNIEYAKALELECIALQMRKQELEEERERFVSSHEYNSNNLDHLDYEGKLSDGILEISRKVDNTARFRLLAIQNLPSLKIVKNADIAIINAIDDAVVNLIPQWKSAFSKALLAYRLYNATSVLDAVYQTTDEILGRSAGITKDAVVKSAEIIERPQVSSETLRKINDSIISMCEEVSKISVEAQEMRDRELPLLKQMEKEALAIETSWRDAK